LKARGVTALTHSTAARGPITSVQRAVPLQADRYAGWADICVAATRRDPALLKALLARGANPNAKCNGVPILNVAALATAPKAVEALLVAGADPARTDLRGDSALSLAARAGYDEVVGVLLAHGVQPDAFAPSGEPVVVAAAKAGRHAVLRALIAAGANMDATDKQGTSALMVIAQTAEVDLAGRILGHAPRSTLATVRDGRHSGMRHGPATSAR
jgi:ankyrin repeat protein